jgi:ribonuclease D
MTAPREQIVTRPEELAEVCAHLAAARRFGFDTEFVGEDSYRPKLCLLQVATAERLILIDPFEAGPLDAFWQLLVDPPNDVIVHAGREEVRLCQTWTGQRPANIFDLQIAAGLVGLSYPLGHANLVYQILGIGLPKTETLTEWRDRPLTPQQIAYAFDDVRYLLPVGAELRRRLESLNRMAWAREEFERLAIWATEEEAPQEKWRKLRGLGSLSRRQLALVRAIFQWREDTAARLNRPPRTLCRDDLIVEIARRNPTKEKDLEVIRGLARRDAPAILAAVEQARALPTPECPTVFPREIDPPQVTLLGNLLSAVVQHLCGELHLAPSLVTTASELRLLARSYVLGEVARGESLLNTGWRRDHIRQVLTDVLEGKLALRIAAANASSPLELVRADH